MLTIAQNESDDQLFIRIVEAALKDLVEGCRPLHVYLIKIDNWFDFKWYAFTGVAIGAIAVKHDDLRIPPFIPDRVEAQHHYELAADIYRETEAPELHIYQNSESNFARKIKNVSDSAMFLWYSGNSKSVLRGSLMFYGIQDEVQSSWYISLVKKDGWQINKTVNISKNEAINLFKTAAL